MEASEGTESYIILPMVHRARAGWSTPRARRRVLLRVLTDTLIALLGCAVLILFVLYHALWWLTLMALGGTAVAGLSAVWQARSVYALELTPTSLILRRVVGTVTLPRGEIMSLLPNKRDRFVVATPQRRVVVWDIVAAEFLMTRGMWDLAHPKVRRAVLLRRRSRRELRAGGKR